MSNFHTALPKLGVGWHQTHIENHKEGLYSYQPLKNDNIKGIPV